MYGFLLPPTPLTIVFHWIYIHFLTAFILDILFLLPLDVAGDHRQYFMKITGKLLLVFPPLLPLAVR